MGYTLTARSALMAAFNAETQAAGWSVHYTYLQVRALLSVPLGTEINATEEEIEHANVDDYEGRHVFGPQHDVEHDVARVALQAEYFGVDPHAE